MNKKLGLDKDIIKKNKNDIFISFIILIICSFDD